MKLLVTGATGFIGQNLTRALIAKGNSVTALCRANSQVNLLIPEVRVVTTSSVEELQTLFAEEKYDGVIHLASLYLMSHKPEDVENLIDSNVKFGSIVIDAASRASVKFFINTGSFAQHFESRPYSPTNLYAATKQAFQDITQYYAETTKTKVVTLELFNTYGPGDTRDKIFNLWHKAIKNQSTLDMSPGEQIIDISYIDDVVEAFLLTIKLATDSNHQDNYSSYAIPSLERMTLKELAKVFAETLDAELKVNFGTLAYRDRETMIPMDKSVTLPGWSPKVSLKEGIRSTFSI